MTRDLPINRAAGSRAEVDEIMQKAISAGAIDLSEPSTEPSMHYGRFQDPDGHLWEIMWMDMSEM